MNPNPNIRFLCFGCDMYYPATNMHNCFAKTKTWDDARKMVDEHCLKHHLDHYNIYDTWTGYNWTLKEDDLFEQENN